MNDETANRCAQAWVNLCDRLKKMAPIAGLVITGNAADVWSRLEPQSNSELLSMMKTIVEASGHTEGATKLFHYECQRRILANQMTLEEFAAAFDVGPDTLKNLTQSEKDGD